MHQFLVLRAAYPIGQMVVQHLALYSLEFKCYLNNLIIKEPPKITLPLFPLVIGFQIKLFKG